MPDAPSSTGTVRPGRLPRATAYYRLRCLALEGAVRRLAEQRDRARRRRAEVVDRYEQILQRRDADGHLTARR